MIANVALCPEHGLHGDRNRCFVCNGNVKQIKMISLDELEEFLKDLPRYLAVTQTAEGRKINELDQEEIQVIECIKFVELVDMINERKAHLERKAQ